MIRSFFGLTRNPFDLRDIELLPGQQEIFDTLKVHCQQGGLCLVLGVPGTGKSVIKQALQRLPEHQHLVAVVGRTLHTYTNTVKLLCEAFRIEFENSAFKCERRLIEQAFALNHAGKSLTTILDDAHLMDLVNLRKLRLLYDDLPKNHNLVLIGRPNLLAALGREGPPAKMSEGHFRFVCPNCGEMRATVNPCNNLAHCFCCQKNLNNIDLLIELDYDFLSAVALLERWLNEYQPRK